MRVQLVDIFVVNEKQGRNSQLGLNFGIEQELLSEVFILLLHEVYPILSL